MDDQSGCCRFWHTNSTAQQSRRNGSVVLGDGKCATADIKVRPWGDDSASELRDVDAASSSEDHRSGTLQRERVSCGSNKGVPSLRRSGAPDSTCRRKDLERSSAHEQADSAGEGEPRVRGRVWRRSGRGPHGTRQILSMSELSSSVLFPLDLRLVGPSAVGRVGAENPEKRRNSWWQWHRWWRAVTDPRPRGGREQGWRCPWRTRPCVTAPDVALRRPARPGDRRPTPDRDNPHEQVVRARNGTGRTGLGVTALQRVTMTIQRFDRVLFGAGFMRGEGLSVV